MSSSPHKVDVDVDGFGTLRIGRLERSEVEACAEQADDLEHFILLLVDQAVPDEQFGALSVEEIAAVLTEYPRAGEQIVEAIIDRSWTPPGYQS